MTSKDQMVEYAQNLLDSEAFNVLIKMRLLELTEETMSLHQQEEIMQAHKQYGGVRDFAEWIQELAHGNV